MSFFSTLASEFDLDNVGSEFAHLYTDAEIMRITERAIQADYQKARQREADAMMHRQLRRLMHQDEE